MGNDDWGYRACQERNRKLYRQDPRQYQNKGRRTLADFLPADKKNLHLSASVRLIQTSLRQIRGLSGDI